jgi:hypothetical protein
MSLPRLTLVAETYAPLQRQKTTLRNTESNAAPHRIRQEYNRLRPEMEMVRPGGSPAGTLGRSTALPLRH